MKTLFTKGFYIVSAIILFIGTALPARAQFTSVTLSTNALATALAKDASGNIYALQTDASGTQGEVVKYTNGTGSPTVIYDGFPDNDGAGDYGTGLTVTSTGDIYLTTDNNGATVPYGNIIKLKFNGGTSYTASVYQTGTANVGYYSALAVDASDNIYAVVYNVNADGGNSGIGAYEVVKYAAGSAANSAGTVLYDKLDAFGLLSGDYYVAPSGLAVNSLGDVYVGDSFDNDDANNDGGHVYKLTKASSYAVSTISTNQYVTSLAVDASNNLYATQVNTFPAYALVRYTGDTGTPTTIYTGLSSDGSDFPYGLAIVNSTNIYVNDGGTNGGTDNQGNIIQLIGTPVTQATNVTFSSTTATTTTATWTNGSGSSRAVFIALASTGSPVPVNKTTYTANAAYASGTQIASSGWYCIYTGTGSTVNITGLTAGQTYRVMATEYNGSAGSQNYLTTVGTNNPNNVTPASTPTINTTGTLAALSTVTGTASASTNFSVSATGLTAGVLVTPPSGFEVSTDNSTFSSTVTVGSTGTLAATTVYVRLAAGDAINTYSGNIVLSSAGATSVNVATISSIVTGQPTVLAAGDIAIVGYDFSFNNSGTAPVGQDNFDIVALKSISAGTVIQFTTRGWTGSAFTSLGTIDGAFTWTVETNIAAGTVFNFSLNDNVSPATVAILPANGTISGITTGEFSGSTAGLAPALGNQLLIYQGSSTAPTFIYGINTDATNVDGTGWVTGTVANNAAQSALPTGLTNADPFDGSIAASALPFTIETNRYNAVYTGPKSANQTTLLKDIANYANWTATSTGTTTYDLTVGGTSFPGSNPIFTLSSNTTIASINRATSTLTNATSVQYSVTFGSAVTGVGTSNFALATTGSISGASISSVSGSGTTYTVTVNTGTGDGTIGLNLANATGITPGISTTLPFTGQTYTIDKTAPTVTISAPSVASTTSGPVSYTVTYADANFNTSTLAIGNITLNKSGTANGTLGISGSGTSYTVTISSISGTGNLGINIASGTASDNAGNSAPAAGPSATFTVAPASPTINASGTLTALSTTYGSASTSESFNVSGSNTNAGILATAPTGFEVSADNTTFSSSVTIGAAGTIASTPIYIRLKKGDAAGNYSGNVVLSSTGATTVNEAIASSTVGQAALTITANNQSSTYGSALPLLTATYGGFVNGDTQASLTTLATISTTATAASPAGNYALVPSGATDNNYAISYVNGTLSVGKAALTITADNQSSTYGSALPALTVAYGGFVNGDTQASLTTQPVVSTTATAASPSGNYTIVPSGAIDNNYTISYVNGTLNIGKATLTITADNQNSTYGSALPTLTATYSGFVNGDNAASLTTTPTLSTTATAASPAGGYTIIPSGATDNNYTISYVNGTLTIGKAALTITANNQNSIYGSALPVLTVTYGGFVNGDTQASLTTAPTASTTATAASPAGNYAIVPSGATDNNYAISYVNGTLTIGQAALTITADNQSRAYGLANPPLTITYSGFVNGDTQASLTTQPTASTTATTASIAGNYPITVSGATDNNYAISYVNGTLSIGKTTLTITANNQSSTYGSALPILTASYSGFINGDTQASLTTQPTLSTTATSASPAGGYTITASGAADNNYNIVYVNGSLNISKAALTITADNQSSTYGSALPTLTATYSGFVNGDNSASLTIAPTLSTTATSASPAANYAITASGAVDNNYTISYVAGTLAIGKAALTITADNQSSTYGSALPTLTASYSGFVNGDNAGSLATAPTLSTTATAASPAGGYPITASGAVDNNYTISYVAGILTVGKAALTITADNQSRAYGLANPTLTISYSGFVNSDTQASLTTQPTASTTATTASIAGNYPITVSGAVDNNYAISYVNGTLSVGKATLTITADNQTKTYGSAIPTLTVSYSGFINGDTQASLTTQPTLSTTATSASPVGGYTITASGAADNNYNIVYVDGTLNIGKAALTVTADNQSSTYGSALPTLTASYSGFVNGDNVASLTIAPTLSTTATSASPTGNYAITASGVADNNYTISYVAGTLTIGKAALTITANNQSSTYGSALPTLTASYSGFVNGDNAASLTTPATLSTTATSASPAGNYAITASAAVDNNYNISYVAGSLTIGQAALTITADNQNKTYGSVNPPLTISYSGFVNGDTQASLTTQPTANTTATTASPNGNYPITVLGAVDNNYAISYVNGTLSVGKATLTITADNQTKTYGSAVPTLTVSYSGFINGDTQASLTTQPTLSTTATSASPAGNYAIIASGATDNNYNIVYVNGALNVTPASLTITADNQSSTYGSAIPLLTASYSGFVNGDNAASLTAAPTLSTTATSVSPAGNYAINASGAVDNNYTISYVNGTLTIGKAALTITADNQSSTYGSALPALTASYSGFVNGDTQASLTTQPTLSTTATSASPAGNYAINASGAADNNYTISYVAGTLTIGQAALNITADNQSRSYGQANPPLTISYSGFVNGDTQASLTTAATASTTATTASPNGNYPITVSGAVDNNYVISYVNGTLSVGKATLTITADNQSKVYGSAIPTLTVSYSGFVNGDTQASLTTQPTISTTATAASATGNYPITASGAADNNYTIVYANGTLTIGQAALTVTADNQAKTYGTANPALTVTYNGFVNGDTQASLTTAPTTSTTATSASPAGNYPITVSGAVDNNYAISYVNGTLTVGQAALTITADNQSKTYGSANPTLTVSYSGFVNGDTQTSLTTQPTVATSATASSAAGNYPITASGAVDNNYAISYVNGTLTVGQAALTITADNQSKIYGSANPPLTISYSGFVNGDTQASLTTQPTASTTATTTSAAGTYPIMASGAVDNNYTISYVNGTLTVGKSTLTITADNQAKTYGQANPTLTISYSGFTNGDTQASLTTQPTASTIATSASAAGNYPITVSGAIDNNYTISYVNGTLTIGQAALTVTANDQSKIYGQVNPGLTVAYSGFVNGDTQASLTTAATASTTATTASPAGAYPITPAGAVDNNYTISYVNGTLTVGQAALTVTADNKTRIYGQPNPPFTVTYNGFVNGDTQTSLTTEATASTTATLTSNVGTYAITPAGAVDNNYAITYVNGTLTITQATQTITFSPLPVKTYGDPDFNPGATASSGLTIIYSSDNTAVATIVNGKVHITGAGSANITATVAVNSNYSNTPSETQPLVVEKANQTIDFASIPTLKKGTQYDLSTVTASSGLPVTITSGDPTIASIQGETLYALHLGITTLTAIQPGDNNYNAAAITQQQVTVDDAAGDNILVHQAVSPNGDGINDYLLIEGIQNYPGNRVTLINRNGVKIYQVNNYDNADKHFDGHSNITGALQEAGTYFYLVEYIVNGETKRKTGYFVLKYQ